MSTAEDTELAVVVGSQLNVLSARSGISAEVVDRVGAVFRLFATEALARPARPPFDGLSHINANGLPFQWCVTLGARPGVRFVCESGVPGTSIRRRSELTLERIGQACDLLDRPRAGWYSQLARDLWLPSTDAWPRHWRSAFWMGVSADEGGVTLKPYVNLNRGTPLDRWRRIGWTLSWLGRNEALARVCELSGVVSRDSWPVGLAVDIAPDGEPGRIKAYFRCGNVDEGWLARWYEALGAAEPAAMLRQVLDSFPHAGRKFPARGVIVGLEVHRDERLSLKTDLAVGGWVHRTDDVNAGVQQALLRLGLDPAEYNATTRVLGGGRSTDMVRYVGLGYEPSGSAHVNVYLEPPLPAQPVRRGRPVRSVPDAVAAGTRYLLETREDSHWVDYRLPVGAADAWATAWVLMHLANVAGSKTGGVRDELQASARWLRGMRRADGGWGYNRVTPSDADTTALAVLALRGFGTHRQAFRSSRPGCLNGDGGLGTYAYVGSDVGTWSASSPEVSAAAAAAFWPGSPPRRLIDYLVSIRGATGLWPAFWWLTPMYATWAVLSWAPEAAAAGRRITRRALHSYAPVGAFETALAILARAAIGLPSESLASELQKSQRTDGSWPPSAWLRLVDRTVSRPWTTPDAGPVYVDESSVFTTAAAVAALARGSSKLAAGRRT